MRNYHLMILKTYYERQKYNKSFGAVLAIVMILAETFRADRAPLQNHANAAEDCGRQAAQNVVKCT